MEKELQTSYRMSSSPSLTSGVSSENELVLNVSNLEENFDKNSMVSNVFIICWCRYRSSKYEYQL